MMRSQLCSFSGGVSLQRELYYDLLLPFPPTQTCSQFPQCLLHPEAVPALVFASVPDSTSEERSSVEDVSKDYQVPCQNNSPSLLKPLRTTQKRNELVWHNVFLGSTLLPLHNSQKPSA